MRKTRRYVQSIAGLALTPNKTTEGFETRAQFYAREAKEKQDALDREQERLMQPVREGEEKLRQVAREHSAKVAKFWSLPLQDVADYGIDFSPLDPIGDYTEGPRDKKAEIAAYEEAKSGLESRGCTLSVEGWHRVGGYLEALHHHRNVSLASADAWLKSVDRLSSLGCFADGELTSDENLSSPKPKPVTPETSGPTMDDLMSLDATTRQGFKDAQKLAHDLGQIELAPVFQAWSQSLVDNFSLYTTAEDRQRITAWFTRNNRRDNRAFDDCRKFMVRQGFWPESALTSEEITARNWEQRTERSDTFESKQELRRQLDHFGTKVLG